MDQKEVGCEVEREALNREITQDLENQATELGFISHLSWSPVQGP